MSCYRLENYVGHLYLKLQGDCNKVKMTRNHHNSRQQAKTNATFNDKQQTKVSNFFNFD